MFHAVALFGAFRVVEAVEGADKVAGDAADAISSAMADVAPRSSARLRISAYSFAVAIKPAMLICGLSVVMLRQSKCLSGVFRL